MIIVSDDVPSRQAVQRHDARRRIRLFARVPRRRRSRRWRLRRAATLTLVCVAVVASCAGVAPAQAAQMNAAAVHSAVTVALPAPDVQPPARASRWLWPLAPPHPVIQAFEAPATRYSAGHRGIDIAAQPGSVVSAPADGVIHFAGVVVDRPVLTLEIAGDLLATGEPVRSGLVAGTAVHAGEAIGILADGGHCSGTCLHFGVRLHGEYVSPLLYLGGVERAVLLPMH